MRPQVELVHDLVRGIEPLDALEAEHRRDTLRWLEGTDDVFRRVRPATPPRHLVAYVAVVDPVDRSSRNGPRAAEPGRTARPAPPGHHR